MMSNTLHSQHLPSRAPQQCPATDPRTWRDRCIDSEFSGMLSLFDAVHRPSAGYCVAWHENVNKSFGFFMAWFLQLQEGKWECVPPQRSAFPLQLEYRQYLTPVQELQENLSLAPRRLFCLHGTRNCNTTLPWSLSLSSGVSARHV